MSSVAASEAAMTAGNWAVLVGSRNVPAATTMAVNPAEPKSRVRL